MVDQSQRRLAAILAADVAGYSRLMRTDEDGTLAAFNAIRTDVIDPKLAEHHGRTVKLMGDGLLVEFGSIVSAVRAAVAIQQAMAERNAQISQDNRIAFRIGINLGDVVIDGDDIHGDGVNIAARLEGISVPGGICISDPVHEQVRDRTDHSFRDLGLRELKNIDRPLRVWQWSPDLKSAPDDTFLAKAPAPLDRTSIAVLPFDNMSGDAEQEYFSDGITEDIITDLARVSELLVIARNSTFCYKGLSIKAQQISADLGARFLVEGSVRKAGNRVRVTAQLIDGKSGGHIWADRYDRELTDVFEVQDDIAKNIVNELKVALAPGERRAIERIPTRNPKAYDCYLRGRQLLHEMTLEKLELARKLFLDAVAVDPEFAFAFTGLADCDAAIYTWYSSDRRFVEAAISNARKALDLDPSIAEAHASMGYALSLSGDYVAAELELKAAIEFDPMLYEAYWYFGMVKGIQEDLETAAHFYSQASQVRGDDLQSKMLLMGLISGLGRHAEACSVAEQTLAITDRRLDLNPDDSRAAYIGALALIHLGDKPRARKLMSIAARIDPDDSRTAYNLACGYSLLGDTGKALDFLERSIEGGRSIRSLDWMTIDPDLAAVRDDPRFEALLKHWRDCESEKSLRFESSSIND